MNNEYQEKNFDDAVYDDNYYEEHYNEEELSDEADYVDDENEKKEDTDDDESWETRKKVTLSFACEECDYRWDEVIIKKQGNLEDEEDEFDAVCPMCGSMNVTQI